eukprot:gene3211-2193_t
MSICLLPLPLVWCVELLYAGFVKIVWVSLMCSRVVHDCHSDWGTLLFALISVVVFWCIGISYSSLPNCLEVIR